MRPQPPLLLRASVLLALTTEGVATGSDIGTLASVPVDNWTLVASEDIEQFVRRDSPMRYHWQDRHPYVFATSHQHTPIECDLPVRGCHSADIWQPHGYVWQASHDVHTPGCIQVERQLKGSIF